MKEILNGDKFYGESIVFPFPFLSPHIKTVLEIEHIL